MDHLFFRFTVKGVVQGVGFRPFVHHACTQAGLLGFVQNTGEGAVVVVNDAKTFQNILAQLPAHMRIDTLQTETISAQFTDFTIRESTGDGFCEIPPDVFLCNDCLEELGDPQNRRHNYFFLTCTACGPRFTMTESSPYDRATTTMRDFMMCPDCQKEYTNPTNRRFHAQTIACHRCGPTLSLYENGKALSFLHDKEMLKYVSKALQNDEIVSVKYKRKNSQKTQCAHRTNQ